MKKAYKIALWVAINSGYWYSAYLGLHGHTGYFNLFRFVAWFMFITTSIAALARLGQEAEGKYEHKHDRSLPAWLSMSSDIVGAAMLAYYGAFFYAGMTVLQISGEQIVFAKPEPKPDPIDKELKEFLKGKYE